MPTTPSTSVKPLEYAKETIIGMTIALEQRFGCQPKNDLNTTLNTKFGVFPTRVPTNEKLVKYFCWGVGGRQNDTTSLSSAKFVLGTNMSPYAIRPFRAVLFEEDLTGEEREKYAMRVVTMINDVYYCLYYLKKIEFSQSEVQYTRTDPVSGITTTYELDYDNLSPTAPTEDDDNGIITDVADQISVVLPASITITGQEVLESVGVIDGGDMRYSIVSELGFVSAATELVAAADINGSPFNYEEAIMAQLTDHYCWVGQPFISTSDSWTRSMSFSMKNVITQS